MFDRAVTEKQALSILKYKYSINNYLVDVKKGTNNYNHAYGNNH